MEDRNPPPAEEKLKAGEGEATGGRKRRGAKRRGAKRRCTTALEQSWAGFTKGNFFRSIPPPITSQA